MKDTVTLRALSLLSIFLFIFHWSYEIAIGMETDGPQGLFGILILVIWLYGTIALGNGRWAYSIMLLGGIFGLGVLILHMQGAGIIGRRIAASSGILYWVWTIIAMGVTSSLSIILAARGLWSMRRGAPR